MVPFTLFISGLLDMLFSTSITSSPDIFPILAASILSCTLVVMVGLLLCFAVMHGIKHPTTSPFQTSFSKFFSALCFADSKHVPDSESPLLNDFKEERELTASNCEVFHLALQETFDDETIDQASAALEGVLKTQGPAAELYSVLSDLGLRTILHLLSPEASLRSNLSAARIVTNLVSDRGTSTHCLLSVLLRRYLIIRRPKILCKYYRHIVQCVEPISKGCFIDGAT